jgi:thiol-disulfide isomerase/thioredoxin
MNKLYNKPAPSFVANDMFGNTIDLNSYKGNVVYLDFWTTWCGACLGSIPNLKRLYEKYHKAGFEIIGIALDKQDKVAKVCKEDKISWPQIVPSKNNRASLRDAYGVVGYPEGFLLNKDGIIVEIMHPNDDRLDFIIQQYLLE